MKKTLFLICAFLLLSSCPAFAGDDVFAPTQELADKIYGFLTGAISITIVAIAIVGCGYRLLTGAMRAKDALFVIGGAILIGGAFEAAEFLMQK